MRLPSSRESGKVDLDGDLLAALARVAHTVERALYYSASPGAPAPPDGVYWNTIADIMADKFPARSGDEWRAIIGRMTEADLTRFATFMKELEGEDTIEVLSRPSGSGNNGSTQVAGDEKDGAITPIAEECEETSSHDPVGGSVSAEPDTSDAKDTKISDRAKNPDSRCGCVTCVML